MHDPMATKNRPDDYSNCLIKPMTSDDTGKPIIKPAHVVDALIVAGMTFFLIMAGDTVPTLVFGNGEYLTLRDVVQRLPLAGAAFGLTFFAQWARARGLEIKSLLQK